MALASVPTPGMKPRQRSNVVMTSPRKSEPANKLCTAMSCLWPLSAACQNTLLGALSAQADPTCAELAA